MQRKSLWKLSAALALPVLALAATTQAATLYNSNSFEGLTTGADLNGQGGWTKYGPSVGAAPGAATVVATGGLPPVTPSSVQFTQSVSGPNVNNGTGPLFTTAYFHALPFNSLTSTDSLVAIDFDLKSNALSRVQSLVGIDSYDGLGNPVSGIYFGTQGGQSTVNGYGGAGASNTNAQAPANTYSHYQVVMNFLTKQYTISVGGIEEITNLPFASGSTTTLSEIDLSFYNGNGEVATFDNIIVTSLPEPASLSLLGLSGLGLLARRRK